MRIGTLLFGLVILVFGVYVFFTALSDGRHHGFMFRTPRRVFPPVVRVVVGVSLIISGAGRIMLSARPAAVPTERAG